MPLQPLCQPAARCRARRSAGLEQPPGRCWRWLPWCDHRHDGLERPPPSSPFRPGASGSCCHGGRKKIKLVRGRRSRPARSPPSPFPSLRPALPPPQHDAPGAAAASPAGEGRAGSGRGSRWARVRGGPGRASRSVPSDVSPRGRGRPSPGAPSIAWRAGVGPARTLACWAAGQGGQRPSSGAGGFHERERETLCWWRRKTVGAV